MEFAKIPAVAEFSTSHIRLTKRQPSQDIDLQSNLIEKR